MADFFLHFLEYVNNFYQCPGWANLYQNLRDLRMVGALSVLKN
jgi:hypothetical protein